MPRASGPAKLRNGAESGVFGPSLTKLLFTILIAVAVWKGFMMIGRLAREREVRVRAEQRTRHGAARARSSWSSAPAAALTSTQNRAVVAAVARREAQTARFLDRLGPVAIVRAPYRSA